MNLVRCCVICRQFAENPHIHCQYVCNDIKLIYIYIYYKSFFLLLDINIKYKLICFLKKFQSLFMFIARYICINHVINFDCHHIFISSTRWIYFFFHWYIRCGINQISKYERQVRKNITNTIMFSQQRLKIALSSLYP